MINKNNGIITLDFSEFTNNQQLNSSQLNFRFNSLMNVINDIITPSLASNNIIRYQGSNDCFKLFSVDFTSVLQNYDTTDTSKKSQYNVVNFELENLSDNSIVHSLTLLSNVIFDPATSKPSFTFSLGVTKQIFNNEITYSNFASLPTIIVVKDSDNKYSFYLRSALTSHYAYKINANTLGNITDFQIFDPTSTTSYFLYSTLVNPTTLNISE